MGGGQFTSVQEELIQSHSLASRVFVIGPYPYKDVVSYARSADIGICLYQNTGLSVYLSTPTKLFDYINAGIPILASDFPGIAEILEMDSTVPLGATVEPNNVKAIAVKVQELLNLSKDDRDCIAQRMRTLHKNSYNWEQQEIKLLDVYTRVSLSL